MPGSKGVVVILAIVVVLLDADAAAGQVATPEVSEELAVAERVLATPRVEEALAYVDDSDEETIRQWLNLCEAYAPSRNEIYRSRLLFKLFSIYGLKKVHIDDAGNVIGVRPGVGEGPTVVLNAHHDNVALWPKDQPIQAFKTEERVWCPAARDDLMGVTQMLTVLRALNAGDIQTEGDIWFVGFTGEEVGSPGAEQFVRANYPHNIDWRDGDILVQFHGGGGEGVTTGSNPYIHFSQLRVSTPLDRGRWQKDAVGALGPIIDQINEEVRDPRSTRVDQYETGQGEMTDDLLYLNMSMVKGNEILNGTSSQAWIRFDLRAPTQERLWQAHRAIQDIAERVTTGMDEGLTYHYEVNMKLGAEGIEGWNKVNNEPARMAVAASQALYDTRPVVDPTRGCGDCRRAYMGGMPALSLRGDVIDYGENGKFEVQEGGAGALQSDVRKKTAGHTVTESGRIVELWSGIKHGLLFAASYAGLAQ